MLKAINIGSTICARPVLQFAIRQVAGDQLFHLQKASSSDLYRSRASLYVKVKILTVAQRHAEDQFIEIIIL